MRALLVFLLLPVVGLAATTRSATADAPTATVVSPGHETDVAGTVPVTMQVTGAPYARLRLRSSASEETLWLPPAPADASGTATVDLPTWGFPWFWLAAEPCAGPEPETCAAPAGEVFVNVVNDAPVIVEPAQRRVVKPSVDGPVPVRVTGAGPDAMLSVEGYRWYRWTRVVPDVQAPLDLALPSGSLGAQGIVHARWCSPVFPRVCDGAVSLGPELVIREELRGSVDGVSADRISPNGDGRLDTTTVLLGLDPEVGQTVRWSLLDSAGMRAAGPFLAGSSTPRFTEEIRVDPWREAGWTLASGRYTLRFHLTADVDGHHFARDLDVPITVDTTPPSIGRLEVDRAVIHPRRGGRPGSVRPQASPRSSWWWLAAQVLDGRGRVVRTLPRRWLPGDERLDTAWDGRDGTGSLVPEGRYRIRLAVRDRTGNQSRALSSWVKVDLTRR